MYNLDYKLSSRSRVLLKNAKYLVIPVSKCDHCLFEYYSECLNLCFMKL